VPKPKFKLGDKVKFSRVAYREMTLLAAENDPKPWYDAKWVSRETRRTTRTSPPDAQSAPGGYLYYVGHDIRGTRWSVAVGVQEGIYIGTRTKQNGILICGNRTDAELRRAALFVRLGSVPCGLVITDVRKSPILVLIEDLEHA
jgi:hypothetical protein